MLKGLVYREEPSTAPSSCEPLKSLVHRDEPAYPAPEPFEGSAAANSSSSSVRERAVRLDAEMQKEALGAPSKCGTPAVPGLRSPLGNASNCASPASNVVSPAARASKPHAGLRSLPHNNVTEVTRAPGPRVRAPPPIHCPYEKNGVLPVTD